MKFCQWKSHVPRLVHALNDDDPDRRVQYLNGTWNDVSKLHTFQQRLCGVTRPHSNLMAQLIATIAPIGELRIRMLLWIIMLIYQELQCGAAYHQED